MGPLGMLKDTKEELLRGEELLLGEVAEAEELTREATMQTFIVTATTARIAKKIRTMRTARTERTARTSRIVRMARRRRRRKR